MDENAKTNGVPQSERELIDSGNAADFEKDSEARDFAVSSFGKSGEKSPANVLLSAAAGSGKTYTLVERIVNRIEALPGDKHVDSFAVVTFTNAAAAELRERIGNTLTDRIGKAFQRGDTALAERLYREKFLLAGATIGTIDSFALDVVKNNFARIGISPNLAIDDEQVVKFREDAMEAVLEEYYSLDRNDPDPEKASKAAALSALTDAYSSLSDDKKLKEVIAEILDYAENVPNPRKWLEDLPESFVMTEDVRQNPWYRRLSENVQERIGNCIDQSEELCSVISRYKDRFEKKEDAEKRIKFFKQLAERMRVIAGKLREDSSAEAPALFTTDLSIKTEEKFPSKRKNADPDEKAFSDLCLSERKRIEDGYDKIVKDLASVFGKKFGEISPQEKERIVKSGFETQKNYSELVSEISVKVYDATLERMKQRAVFTFSQIEHFALEVLNDGEVPNHGVETLSPSDAALAYRQKFTEIYLDEYQDTSEIQECIIHLVSGIPEGDHNVFMVGDIKQSIYGFRNARPDLFLSKFNAYRGGDGHGALKILSKNFRSRKAVLDGVNEVFFKVMTPEAAKIDYKNGHKLNYGAEKVYGSGEDPVPWDPADGKNELILCGWEEAGPSCGGDASKNENAPEGGLSTGNEDSAGGVTPSESAAVEKKEREYAVVAEKICSLFENGFMVYDKDEERHRPLCFKDICIIAYSNKKLRDQRTFLAKAGFPTDAGGEEAFFDAEEVRDVINLLRIVDNPRNDVPLAALLLSRYFGMDESFLAAVRYAGIRCGAGSREDLWVCLHAAYGRIGLLSGYAKNTGGAARGGDDPISGGDPLTDGGNAEENALRLSASRIISDINALRESSRRLNVSQFVWKCINFKNYYDGSGVTAKGNLRELMDMSESFDGCAGGGLAGFVARLEQLIAKDEEYASDGALHNRKGSYSPRVGDADKIRFMTIHKSKGLEFPVVFFIGTNGSRGSGNRPNVFIDKDLGAGFKHSFRFEPEDGSKNPFRSITTTVAARIIDIMKQTEDKQELQRKLYVALTRAREKLIVTGEKKSKDVCALYEQCGIVPKATAYAIRNCGDSYDLLRLALAGKENEGFWSVEERNGALIGPLAERVRAVVSKASAEGADKNDGEAGAHTGTDLPPATEDRQKTLSESAFEEADDAKRIADALSVADGASLPTKISVSALKRYAVDEDGAVTGEPYSTKMKAKAFRRPGAPAGAAPDAAASGGPRTSGRSGAAFGTLMHMVMKWAVEDRSAWPENAAEASGYAADFIRRKQSEGLLGAEEASLADPEMIARFISSERGREVRTAEKVRCEVPFTYRTDMRKYLGAADKVLRDAARGGGGEGDAEGRETRPAEHSSQERSLSVENNLKEEKIIVIQGVVDLYYKLRDRVVIVDFKTDHIRGDGSVDNIAAYDLQLTCYRDALGEISGRSIDESVLFFLRNGQEHSI